MRRLASLFIAALLLVWAAPSSGQGEHAYIGSKQCKKCHVKQYKSWLETSMAKSFELLKPGERAEQKTAAGLDATTDYTKDPECLPCHTVGYGKQGGFVDIETTPNHAGVGCEMCHGAGGTYALKENMSLKNKRYKLVDIVAVGLNHPIESTTCTGLCHNDNSPFAGDDYVFDFAVRKEEGTHVHLPLKYEH